MKWADDPANVFLATDAAMRFMRMKSATWREVRPTADAVTTFGRGRPTLLYRLSALITIKEGRAA